MALRKCKECGHEISSKAGTCPNCGIKSPGVKHTGCIPSLIVIIGVLIVINYLQGGDKKTAAPTPQQTTDRINYNMQDVAQEEIKKRMKDPDSVKFKDVYVSRISGNPIVCGWVNSKNSLGGYSGFHRFMSNGLNVSVLESDMAAGEIDKSWNFFCGK